MKSLPELFEGTEILDYQGMQGSVVESLCSSSADVQKGALFFAVKGRSHDGHLFCLDALKAGAAGVVIDNPAYFPVCNRAILVQNTRELLGPVADRFWDHPSSKFSVVAVTGTNGKTTTTHLLDQAWTFAGHNTGLIGTVRYKVGNNEYPAPLTTPDALSLQNLWHQMASQKVKFASIEASSIALEQSRLSGTRIRAGVFTNFTQDHLDYHLTMESYFQCKKKLFTDFDLETAVVGVDDAWGQRLFDEISTPTKFRFSVTGKPAEFQLLGYEIGSQEVEARLNCLGQPITIRTYLLGRHNIANILAAAATMVGMGWRVGEALEILSRCAGAPGRLERVRKVGQCEVLVDYAHSEDALDQVLKSLQPVKKARGGRIITVFGCGGDRDKSKRPKMAKVVSELSDVTIATSDNPRTEDPDRIIDDIEEGILRGETSYLRETDRRLAIQTALKLSQPNDVLLIAGKGHETYQILGKDKVPFDDREVVREYFGLCSPTPV